MSIRQTVEVPVRPWYRDHFFNGTTIFPAVESMLFLAGVAREIRPDTIISTILKARFLKLLTIPKKIDKLTLIVEYDEENDNSCNDFQLRLLSRVQFRKISRIKAHVEVAFPNVPGTPPGIPDLPPDKPLWIETERIYQELVPFGPSYRTLKGELQIFGSSCRATLQAQAPGVPHIMEKEIGSPFLLDGAMHAASVLGQCLSDFVPFPVGFAKRFILRPTLAGHEYSTIIVTKSQTKEELLFDLWIIDPEGEICESVTGLRMRDVSKGTIKPPQNLPHVNFHRLPYCRQTSR